MLTRRRLTRTVSDEYRNGSWKGGYAAIKTDPFLPNEAFLPAPPYMETLKRFAQVPQKQKGIGIYNSLYTFLVAALLREQLRWFKSHLLLLVNFYISIKHLGGSP